MDFVPNPNNPNQANVPFNAHSAYQLPPGGFSVGNGPPPPYGGDDSGAGGVAGSLGGGAGLGLNLATPGGTANALFTPAAGAGDFSAGPSRSLVGVSLPVTLPSAPRERSRCQHPGCNKAFAWPQDLSKHVRRYHAGEPPRFACPREGCGKKFFERKLLVAHERTHTDERPFACPHPGCGKAFRARNALAYHVKARHESGETYACPEPGCAFTTRRVEALAKHRAGHERRDVAKEWQKRKKEEVAAAVRGVKSALSDTAGELARAEKELARERREHAKERRRLEKLTARRDALRARVAAGAEARKEAKRSKRDGGFEKTDTGATGSGEASFGARGAPKRGEGIERDARSAGEGERRALGGSDSDSDSDAEPRGIVLPDDDDTPIVSKRVTS